MTNEIKNIERDGYTAQIITEYDGDQISISDADNKMVYSCKTNKGQGVRRATEKIADLERLRIRLEWLDRQ